jgi:hypothetical protein
MEAVVPTSAAGAIRSRVTRARPGRFFRRKDFGGSDRAVESALSRLVAEGELLRVRKGLYWRGRKTRFGMTRPTPTQVALAVAGSGSGPAGIAAAHALGLTTQVPATVEIAVPGKAPEPLHGVRFRSRPPERRARRLRPSEVAVLEVLRDPRVVEVPWDAVAGRVGALVASGEIRPSILRRAAADEHVPAVRAGLAEFARSWPSA